VSLGFFAFFIDEEGGSRLSSEDKIASACPVWLPPCFGAPFLDMLVRTDERAHLVNEPVRQGICAPLAVGVEQCFGPLSIGIHCFFGCRDSISTVAFKMLQLL